MKNSLFIVFVVFAFLLAVSPYVLRFANHNSTVPGSEAYLYLSRARAIHSFFDLVRTDFYTVLLYGFSLFFGLENSSRLLPFFLALCSVVLLYFSLSSLLPSTAVFFILFSFLLSPLYVSISFFSSTFSFLLFLLSALFYAIIKEKFYFIFILTVFLSFVGFSSAFFSFFILFFLFFFFNKKSYSYLLFYLAVVIVFYYLPSMYDLLEFPVTLDFSSIFVDFGGSFGISSFIFILGIIGLFSCWYFYKKYVIFYIFCIFTIISSLFNSEFIFFSSLFLSAFAGYALYLIFVMQWELSFIKNASLLVLFCSLFFSYLSFMFAASSVLPHEDIKMGFLWLSSFDLSDSLIFSSPANGWWIEYFSSNSALLHANSENSERIFKEIMNAGDIFVVKKILDKYSVSFLVISNDFYSSFGGNEGLLFLLKDSETFKRVYSNDYLEIWEYKK